MNIKESKFTVKSNFKHTQKRIIGGKTEKDVVKLPIFDINIIEELECEIKVKVLSDFKTMELPKEGEAFLILTEFVRNPNDIISNIEGKEGINNLTVASSRISGFSYIDECDLIISSQQTKFKALRNHAKIILINDYTILSSGNLNKTNASIEQYLIIASECLRKKINTAIHYEYKNSIK